MNFNYYIKYGIRYSLRYILKYIIRLIIFLSIIYLISFLSGKHLFISDVHAETYTPKSITYNLTNGSPTDTIRYKVLDNIPVYYYSYGGQTWMSSISFNYSNFSNNLINKPLNFSGTFYTTNRTDTLPEPFRVWVLDNNTNTTYGCTTQSSGQATIRGSTSYWNTFTCSNVVITFSDFRIYVGSNFYSDGEIGISRINIQHSELSDINNTNKDINNSVKDTNNTIKDDNVDSSTNQGSSFFNDFNSGDEGNLSDIVSLPLEYVQHLNDTCKPFTITAGNLGNITIPCLSSIWSSTPFAGVINTASIIINGIICYKLLTSLFLFFKELKDPDDDKVEVMDL